MIREKIREKLVEWKLRNPKDATLLILDSFSYQELIDELNYLAGCDIDKNRPKIEKMDFYADFTSIMMVCQMYIEESDKRFCGFARVEPDMFDL